MAPANQLRLSFVGSEDGEAETETCRAAKLLWRKDASNLRPARAQLTEPPYADPLTVVWQGRTGDRSPYAYYSIRRFSITICE